MARALKDMVDREVVEDLAGRVAAEDAAFDDGSFVEDVVAALAPLELKQRIELMSRRLRAGLDDDYREALAVVVAVARAEPPIGGWAAWPLCTFVELFGLDHPDESLAAMAHLTKRSSCEFAIRPFLREHPERTFAELERFVTDDDEAVRRLVSEGTRPRLPWGTGVPGLRDDPARSLALLERLRHDPSAVVRRSVANHLNDIAKDHPAIVVETTTRWRAETPPVSRALVAHALRTLVKQGHPGALATFGSTVDAEIEVVAFEVTPVELVVGDDLEMTATIRSTGGGGQRLVVDVVVHHVTASGGTAAKVFKWTVLELDQGEERTIRKRRRIDHMSTRRYHLGVHRVQLQVAGVVVAEDSFRIVGV